MKPILIISKAEAMNPSRRNTMEDVHVTYAPEKWGCKDAEMTFIGVYDGHGGRDTVDFLEEKLHVSIADELNMTQDGASTQEKLERAVLMTDAECRMAGIESSGATVVVCLVKRHGNGRKITIHSANAGDARAVLSCQPTYASNSSSSPIEYPYKPQQPQHHQQQDENNRKNKRPRRNASSSSSTLNPQAYRITYDHKSDNTDEIKRIEDAGGFLLKNRVLGIMAVARSLGDQGMKEYVIGRPFVNTVEIDLDYIHKCHDGNGTTTTAATAANNATEWNVNNGENAIHESKDDESNSRNNGDTSIQTAAAVDDDNDNTNVDHDHVDEFSSHFMIVACDGIWDVLEDQEAIDLVRNYVKQGSTKTDRKKYKQLTAKMLCEQALHGGSTDNVTVLVVWF